MKANTASSSDSSSAQSQSDANYDPNEALRNSVGESASSSESGAA